MVAQFPFLVVFKISLDKALSALSDPRAGSEQEGGMGLQPCKVHPNPNASVVLCIHPLRPFPLSAHNISKFDIMTILFSRFFFIYDIVALWRSTSVEFHS